MKNDEREPLHSLLGLLSVARPFLTDKDMPGEPSPKTEITDVSGLDETRGVVQRAIADYRTRFGALASLVAEAIGR